MSRGKWLPYTGVGMPCDPEASVDVCEGTIDVIHDIIARQAFDQHVTHWRISPEHKRRQALATNALGEAP